MKTKAKQGATGAATAKVAPMTTAAFIKGKIKEGKLDNGQILVLARRRAPKQKIGSHYVSWYRWQMKQKGGGYRGGGKKVRRMAQNNQT